MPKVALADTLTDWDVLLANAGPLAEGDPQLALHLEKLRAVLGHTRDTADRRRHLEGQLRQATQDLEADKAAGKDLAFRIRAKLKAIHGPTSPRSSPTASHRVRPAATRRPPSLPALPKLSASKPSKS